MSSSKLHPSLPAPVVHAGFSVSQSKSHVLAGVQDAYWSDDEGEDAECPLCLEEMDISDLNFKPCICGYQVCRFCWHHIKENLNGRCPACRRVYTDEAVQFKPIAKEDHKRLTQQKKQRERERKELDALGRRHLSNVRVVQRNVVYVVGIGPRFAKEELISTLRSNEYFGQYGKISKILLVKRTPSGGGSPVVGLYITYHRREDAARAISAVDGTTSPGGGRDVMRASYGTTKYCMAFLRGVTCSDHGCMNLHEWGDEKDCFTKEDLTTLKHTMKATESRSRTITAGKRVDESDGLPRAASWAHKGSTSASAGHTSLTSTSRHTRRSGGTRQTRNTVMPHSDTRPPSATARTHQDRKAGSASTATPTKSSSQASSSRPPTPASTLLPQRPATPADVKALRQKKEQYSPTPPSCRSPTSSVAVASDLGSGSQDVAPASPSIRPRSTESILSSSASVLSARSMPPGPPAVPPGLSVPPGVPASITTSPQMPLTPLLASQSSYQMSTAAKALLDDVKARWETTLISAASPFPDLDRTLESLSAGDGQFSGFSFNMDPKLAGDGADDAAALLDFEAEANTPFHGSYFDAFPGLKSPGPSSTAFMAPPGLSYSRRAIYDPSTGRSLSIVPLEKQSTEGSSYTGSFNPFSDNADDSLNSSLPKAQYSPLDDDCGRKMSRFGFAQGRKVSTAASSPLHAPSPMSNSDSQMSFYTSGEFPPTPAQPQWMPPRSQSDYGYPPPTSPLVHSMSPQMAYSQQHGRFQPFEPSRSETEFRDLTQSSRIQSNIIHSPDQHKFAPPHPTFHDPVIMSARFASPMSLSEPGYIAPPALENSSNHLTEGPAGLSYPQGVLPSSVMSIAHGHGAGSGHLTKPDPPPYVLTPPPSSPPLPLSPSDFPALTSVVEPRTNSGSQHVTTDNQPLVLDEKAQVKAERKAAKKAAAAEKAAEKQLVAQEKAAAKAAERAKAAQEKALEKERAATLKAQQEKLQEEKDKALQMEKEKAAKLEKERAAKAESELAMQAEREKAIQGKKVKQSDVPKPSKRPESVLSPQTSSRHASKAATPTVVAEPPSQVPLLSKRPKKNKPSSKPIRVPKEEEIVLEARASITPVLETPHIAVNKPIQVYESSSNNSRAQSVDHSLSSDPTSVEELLEEIDLKHPNLDLPNHPFFDLQKVNPAARMPLEYGPLVHALSALSVGGGSFANNMPSGSIDNAVSSFQQLLETLTQTISDLLRLLPRTTWDDSSSFDGVLRDMLKGDDFLDDGGDDGPGKEDEVAALTLALERRARWMEVQLSKLEELHRDINTAAVRAVLSFNDNGWDRHGFLPRVGNTLRRFDNIGMVDDSGTMRFMTADELEKKLLVAKEATVFAEAEVREIMEKMQTIKPLEAEI